VERGPIRYTRSGDVNIAYQVTGDGPLDLVLVAGLFSHLEIDWEHHASRHIIERLSSFARLIRFDKRATGLPDRSVGLPDFEARMDDVRAVMDAVGSERAALFGYSEGGPMCVLFAATYPARTHALVLYGTYAKRLRSDDWAPTWDERVAAAEALLEAGWGDRFDLETMAPDAPPDLVEWFGVRGRAGLSPRGARDLILMNSQADVRDALPLVQAPTLVLHRTGDLDANVAEGRFIAERIPGARFVELPGEDHVPHIDSDQILDEIEKFLTGVRPAPVADRVLATVLFTDLDGSTELAQKLGDRRWSELVGRHDDLVRRELARFGGEEVDTAGDGFFALFEGPTSAIRCALAARESIRALDLDVRIGIHTGEVERPTDGKPRGIAVNVGARVAANAQGGEVLVSATTYDLVAGSGLTFDDRGEIQLKSVGVRRLYAATA
jgi:class 3 adenylate cyclase